MKACAMCIARFASRAGAATMRTTSSSGPAAFAKSNSSSRRCSWCAVGASRRFAFAAPCRRSPRCVSVACCRPRRRPSFVDAYVFLRMVEHRLQYRDDAQTHDLPHDDADRAALAEAMACSDAAAFDRLLDRHRNNVDRHFDALFPPPTAAPSAIRSPSSGSRRHPRTPIWPRWPPQGTTIHAR